MSLKALAERRLALIRGDETAPETNVKQVKQEGEPLFHEGASVSPTMKHAKPQKTAENSSCFTVSSPRARNSETSPLPDSIAAGLERLRHQATPRISQPKVWPEIVADALRLSSEGWAQQALALGWEPIQIFGWSPERDGVAVWLAGGAPMFTATSCTVRIGGGAYRCMDRRPMPGAVLLWEIGRG
jgi:hypothetical protein